MEKANKEKVEVLAEENMEEEATSEQISESVRFARDSANFISNVRSKVMTNYPEVFDQKLGKWHYKTPSQHPTMKFKFDHKDGTNYSCDMKAIFDTGAQVYIGTLKLLKKLNDRYQRKLRKN